jgi:AcrR family transcriptional regulator
VSRIPFYKTSSRKKRQPLDQAQVVKAAMELLDAAGLDQLTMRMLAQRLHVKAAALYRHVRNKEELLALIGDEISAGIPLPRTDGTWQQQLADSAWNVRRGLAAHRDAARVLASSPPAGPRRLRHIEALLRILRSAGLDDRAAAHAGYHLNNFVTEFAADEARLATHAAAVPGLTRRKMLAEVRRQFRSLSKDEYPTLVALAEHIAADDQDALFEFGIEMCIAGIETLAGRR